MIKSVIREHHLSPKEISSLFHDGIDYFGLIWWYDDVKFVSDSLNKK